MMKCKKDWSGQMACEHSSGDGTLDGSKLSECLAPFVHECTFQVTEEGETVWGHDQNMQAADKVADAIAPEAIAIQTQVVIRIGPEVDAEIIALQAEVAGLGERAREAVVFSVEDAKLITDDLVMMAQLRKAIESKKREYTEPISGHLTAVRDVFKSLLEPLAAADTTLRDKIIAYNKEQDRKRAAQEQINRLRNKAAQDEMKLTGELSESVNEVEVQPEQPKIYRAQAGTAGLSKNWDFAVDDFSQVPEEYKIINRPMVLAKVRAGGKIPGINAWNEPSLRITSGK